MTEWAVKGRHKSEPSKVVTLRRGFASKSEAEDYGVRLAEWDSIWIAEMPPGHKKAAEVPPGMPWTIDARTTGFFYILDCHGRRIACLLGPRERKEAVAKIIGRIAGGEHENSTATGREP